MGKYSFAAELEKFGPQPTHRIALTPRQSRRYCRRLASRHYENFTVISRLLPGRLRQHFCNIYAYCRWADDLADEAGDPKLSMALLNWWDGQLRACYKGQCSHPVFIALDETIKAFKIPIEPFVDLLVAFRQDQQIKRYETFDHVLNYCRYSANPVGRLLLHLGQCATPERLRLSDSICTGLQLANFCQDVSLDFRRGRLYMAAVDCHRFGVDEAALAADKTSPALERLVGVYCEHAEGYLRAGWPLVALMPYEMQLSVAAFVHGGLAILAAIRRNHCDVWTARPRVGRFEKLRILARCWWRLQRGALAETQP